MSPEEIEEHKAAIDKMTREQMCRYWRFMPAGHPYFRAGTELAEYFEKRFKELGEFSPELSKKIGWRK